MEVIAKKRTGDENIVTCIRKTMANYYGEKPVGLGGTFMIERGKAKIHVMVTTLKIFSILFTILV